MSTVEKQHLFNLLQASSQNLGLSLSDQQIEKLIGHITLLNKWNQVYNLTAIKNPIAMLTRHILDSLSIVNYLIGDTVIDVGSGPGLPGIPLALYFPKKQFLLLDSNSKKTRFLIQAIAELSIHNASVIHSRVELFQTVSGFDCVLTRAFASLRVTIESIKHLCAPSGRILAMCGFHPDFEVLEHLKDWNIKVYPLQVPDLHEQRHLTMLERKQDG